MRSAERHFGGNMIKNIINSQRLLGFIGLLLFGTCPNFLYAQVSTDTITQFTSVPVNLSNNDVAPLVMINSSHDHQLYFKAYNDYSDLDPDIATPDGEERTYKHSIDYYGYFDSYKCYSYNSAYSHSTGNGRFEPKAVTTDKYCTGANDAYWSGNFLNWATMTRIDTIRKLLFGGHRRVDTKTDTVLERAFLPPDIHSFAKFYDGSDVAKLTPYTPSITAPTTTSTTNRTIGTGNKTFSIPSTASIKIGDFLSIIDHANAANFMKGWVNTIVASGTAGFNDVTVNVTTIGAVATKNLWDIINHTRTGITICNTTFKTGLAGKQSHVSDVVNTPPLSRVALGNYSFWSAGEVNQCLWEEEDGNNPLPGGNGMNYNNPVLSDIPAAQDRPYKAYVGVADTNGALLGDFVARVQACVPGLLGEEKCKLYPYGNYKPIGLLQVYGDDNQLMFGMIAGTYGKSRTGGDLVQKINNQDGKNGMCREVNAGVDCNNDGAIDSDNGGSDGVVATNHDDLADATHAIGDGTFKLVYQDAGGPVTNASKSEGIINTWSLYRIYGYTYGDWNYNSNSGDSCPLGVNFFALESDSKCRNWGNPFSEIYLGSMRYFSGFNSPISYQSSDSSLVTGINLGTGVWKDPLDTTNRCARLSIINFNSSVSSADTFYGSDAGQDELDASAFGLQKDFNSSDTSKQITDYIGTQEGISTAGKTWFIGENGTNNDHRCTPKTIPNFGDARGFCPEGPDLRGGFRIAGLAYYAHKNDLRATGTNALAGAQNIDTYAIKLAAGSPTIEIPVPGSTTGQKVTLLPACIDNNKSDYGCTMVDFKIIQPHTVTSGVGTGKFLVIWEDSLQGNDYDLDAGGTISYSIDANQITVTTAITLQNLGYMIGSGYVIGGTSKDGLHIHSGTNSFNYTDPSTITGCTNCTMADTYSSRTYPIGSSGSGLLEDPLWYAAKWGGFTDSNGNGWPDVQSEWDRIQNNDGTPGPDGIPDTYYYATNPLQLENALNRVFLAILQRTSSGTAAALVSTNVSGVGALYQAFYEPLRKDALGNDATWIGTLQSLWLDSYGYLRENDGTDASGNVKLDGYNTDKVIQLYYDDIENRTRARRYTSTKNTEFAPYYMKGIVTAYNSVTGNVTFTIGEIGGNAGSGPYNEWTVYNLTTGNTSNSTNSSNIIAVNGSPPTFTVSPILPFNIGDSIMVAHFASTIIELPDIGTLWNARKRLSVNATNTTMATQRIYSDKADGTASGLRYIKTWIDKDLDGIVDAGEFVDFANTDPPLSPPTGITPAIVPSNFHGFFNVATKTDAVKVIDFIRGNEVTGYRKRSVDYDNDGNTEVMRLADIVDSTPTAVSAPQENFDLLYKDITYTAFKEMYAKRRQVIYAGSNGGMLHAFNGGFYDSVQQAFLTSGKKYDGTAAINHPLGAELWSYVPMNLLPHLKWLTYNNYTHVYYVDGKPKVFDTKIFTPSSDHPGGWGTVLIVGMRFGGGKMTIDTAADGLNVGTDNKVFSSAFVIMDITNPEAEPKLLAEIQVPNTSFTTSYPAIMTVKDKVAASDANKWYLTFGSGPDNSTTGLASAASTTTAKFYVYDLEEMASPGSSTAGAPVTDGVTTCTQTGSGLATTMKILACDTNIANSFSGDVISVDWDLDYKVDSVYFGTVGDKTANRGKVVRFAINESTNPVAWTVPKVLIDTQQPVVAGVTPGVDETGKKWIFFGTGRFFVGGDQTSINTQSIYGIKDAGSEVLKTSLIDVSSAEVDTSGNLTGVGTITTINALETAVSAATAGGWYRNMPPIQGTAGVAPSTRVINSSALAGGVLFTTAYQPGVAACAGEGFSRLYGLYYKTGTAYLNPTVFGTEWINGVERAKAFIELGYGFAASPSLHIGSGSGDDAVSVFTQLSTGAIIRTEANTVFGVRSGMDSWRQPK